MAVAARQNRVIDDREADYCPLTWTQKKAQLRFSLGDYSLFSLHFEARTFVLPLAPLLSPVLQLEIDASVRSAAHSIPLLCIRNRPIENPLPALRMVDDRLQYAVNQCRQYYVDLNDTFENYLASLSGKTRSTLKRKVKKFAALNGDNIDWRIYSRPHEMPEYHRLAREVAAKTYQERLFGGAIPADDQFKRQLIDLAARQQVRGYLLFSNQIPIAYLHLPIERGVAEYAYLGYDPAHASVSPGAVLLYSALSDLFARSQLDYLDLSYGAGQTKEVFSTGSYLRADVFYFSRTMKHYLAAYGHCALDSASSALGRTLQRLELRAAMKRLLRRHN